MARRQVSHLAATAHLGAVGLMDHALMAAEALPPAQAEALMAAAALPEAEVTLLAEEEGTLLAEAEVTLPAEAVEEEGNITNYNFG